MHNDISSGGSQNCESPGREERTPDQEPRHQVPAPVLSPVLTQPSAGAAAVEVSFGSLFKKGLGTQLQQPKCLTAWSCVTCKICLRLLMLFPGNVSEANQGYEGPVISAQHGTSLTSDLCPAARHFYQMCTLVWGFHAPKSPFLPLFLSQMDTNDLKLSLINLFVSSMRVTNSLFSELCQLCSGTPNKHKINFSKPRLTFPLKQV